MKLPKKVNICGKTYTVDQNDLVADSYGRTGPQLIVIGTEFGMPERIWDSFVHETAELIMAENNFRYECDGEYRFVMDHKEFDKFAVDLAMALFPMVEGRKTTK